MPSPHAERGASFPSGRAASCYENNCKKSKRGFAALGLDQKLQGVGRKLPVRGMLCWLRLADREHWRPRLPTVPLTRL